MKQINPKEVQLMIRRIQLEEKEKYSRMLKSIRDQSVKSAAYQELLQRALFVAACTQLELETTEKVKDASKEINELIQTWIKKGGNNVERKGEPPEENDPKPPAAPKKSIYAD